MNRYIRILTYSFFILKLRVLSVITLFFPRDIPNLSGNDKAKKFVDDDINLEKKTIKLEKWKSYVESTRTYEDKEGKKKYQNNLKNNKEKQQSHDKIGKHANIRQT